jgi:hypothetical protein
LKFRGRSYYRLYYTLKIQGSESLNYMIVPAGDTCLRHIAGCLARIEIKKLVKSIVGEGLFGTDNEFLVDTAFAFTNPVDLAYR